MAILADSINNNGIYAVRAEADKDGNRIDTVYAKKTEVPSKTSDLTNDSHFVTSSDLATVAQTGSYTDLTNKPDLSVYATTSAMETALAGKQATIPDLDTIRAGASAGATAVQPNELPSSDELVPSATSGDSGKVLTVDAQGNPSWQTPASVTVDQTYNASSTNAQSGTAVAQAIAAIPSVDEVPDVTSSDDGKVLKATYSGGQGSYAWGTDSDTTYTAGNMIAINANNSNAIGVSTTAGITDIQVVNSLPASPVATVLYLVPET